MALSDDVCRQLRREAEQRSAENRTIVELAISSAQGPRIRISERGEVLNLCANDYLGLANDGALLEVLIESVRRWGLASAAGRIVSGTFSPHQVLERRLSEFLAMEESMLFSSCFDANLGLFEALTGEDDVIFSDSHNHASIIDGIRLSRAKRVTYSSRDLTALRAALAEHGGSRRRLIVTDGVFSMDGGLADLPTLCELAEEFDAMLVVDDSHGTGVLGHGGRGTVNALGVEGRVDLITGTLGKALGGVGGFIAGRAPLIEALRQRARPYLFSNSIPAAYAEALSVALGWLDAEPDRARRLVENVALMREALGSHGLDVGAGEHPIIPIIVGDEGVARRARSWLLDQGVMVAALSYPVVARGAARLRVQVSAMHDPEGLVRAASLIGEAIKHARAGEVGVR